MKNIGNKSGTQYQKQKKEQHEKQWETKKGKTWGNGKHPSSGLCCFLSSFFCVVLFAVLFHCGWWWLSPLVLLCGAVSMIGLCVVLGTNRCGRKESEKQ